MMDFSREQSTGDLELAPATYDLATESDDLQNIIDELNELFGMQPADDIDFPEMFCDQAQYLNSDIQQDKTAMIKDARKLIGKIDGIDAENSSVSLDSENRLSINIKTKTGLDALIKI